MRETFSYPDSPSELARIAAADIRREPETRRERSVSIQAQIIAYAYEITADEATAIMHDAMRTTENDSCDT